MFGKRAAAVVARVAILSVAPFMLGATGFTSNFDERILAAHNRERLAMGVAPLTDTFR